MINICHSGLITWIGIGFSFICTKFWCVYKLLNFAFSCPCLDFSKIQVSAIENSGEICYFEPSRGLLHTFLLSRTISTLFYRCIGILSNFLFCFLLEKKRNSAVFPLNNLTKLSIFPITSLRYMTKVTHTSW